MECAINATHTQTAPFHGPHTTFYSNLTSNGIALRFARRVSCEIRGVWTAAPGIVRQLRMLGHSLPSHISKAVLSTVYVGGAEGLEPLAPVRRTQRPRTGSILTGSSTRHSTTPLFGAEGIRTPAGCEVRPGGSSPSKRRPLASRRSVYAAKVPNPSPAGDDPLTSDARSRGQHETF